MHVEYKYSVRYQIYYNSRNINTTENNNGTTQYMKPQDQNNTFIDRKQCSVASSRGKPPTEKFSITIILKTETSHALKSYLF
jgi:hypothetical protein